MMEIKPRSFQPIDRVMLEDLVPAGHFYRHLDRTFDLSFVRNLVQTYCASCGRPSIDPGVFFKLQLVMIFEGLHRSTLRYRTKPTHDDSLRRRLRELAAERPRFGYRRLRVLLRREGDRVNHKRVHPLYRAEGLVVRRRPRKRVAVGRGAPPTVGSRPNDRWCLDFVSDTLASGRRIRALAVLDTCTREALSSEVDTSLPATRVVRPGTPVCGSVSSATCCCTI